MPVHLCKILVSVAVLLCMTASSAIAQSENKNTCQAASLGKRQDLVFAQEEKCEKVKGQKENLQKRYTDLLPDTSKAAKSKLKSLKSLISRTDRQIKSICKKAVDSRRKYSLLINACKKFTTPAPTPSPTPVVPTDPVPSPTPVVTPTPIATPTPTPRDTTLLPPAGCASQSVSQAYPGKIKLKISNSRNGTAVEALGDGSSLCVTDNLTIFGGDDLTVSFSTESSEGFKVIFDFGENHTCRERYLNFNPSNVSTAELKVTLNDCLRGNEVKVAVLPQGADWTSRQSGLLYTTEKVGSADGNPDPQWFTTANKCTVEFFSDAQPVRPGRIKIDALNLRTQQRSELLLKSGYYCSALSTPYVSSLPGDVIELRVAVENAEQVFINVSSASFVTTPSGEQTPNCPGVYSDPNMHFAYSNSVTRHRFTMPKCLTGTEMKFSIQPIGKSWSNYPAASYGAATLVIR